MRVSQVLHNIEKSLRDVLRALANNLTARDNFAPEGERGQVLTSNGTDAPPSFQDATGVNSGPVDWSDIQNIPDLATQAELDAAIAGIPPTDLSNYYTKTQVDTLVAGYIDPTELSTALASYVTSASLTTTLSSYVTSASLTTTLAGYVTNASLTTTLASYVTNSSLSTTLAGYATTSALTSEASTRASADSALSARVTVLESAATSVNPITTKGDIIIGVNAVLADATMTGAVTTYDTGNTAASNATDGNSGTAFIAPAAPLGKYFQIDMGSAISAAGIRLNQGISLPPYVHFASQIRVDYSVNGSVWNTVYTSPNTLTGGDTGNLDFGTVVSARYFRVYGVAQTNSWSNWYMYEIVLRVVSGVNYTRKGIGADGKALVADSTQTDGAKYAGPKYISLADGTELALGAVNDGEYLKRSGTSIIGGTGAGGGSGGTLVNGPATTDYVRVRRTTAQAIATGTWTTISWSDAPDNPSLMWDAANPTRLVAKKAGFFVIGSGLNFASTNCEHFLRILKNGATPAPNDMRAAQSYATNFAQSRPEVVQGIVLAANDYIEIQAFHNFGSSVNIAADQEYSTAWMFLVQGGGGSEILITETVLNAATASVTFSSIPATYRDLRIVVRGRLDYAGTDNTVIARFNGDAGANYDACWLIHNGANTLFDGDQFAVNQAYVGQMCAATAPAGSASVCEIAIPDYRGTTFHKGWTSRSPIKRANSTGQIFEWYLSGWWRSTAAINSILIAPGGGNFIAGTVISIYGKL